MINLKTLFPQFFLLAPLLAFTLAKAGTPSPLPEVGGPEATIPNEMNEFKAKLLIDGAIEIKGLSWPSIEVILEAEVNGEEQKIIASVPGVFLREEWGLLINDKVQNPDKDGKFIFKTEVSGSAYELRLLVIGPTGEVERSKIGLSIPTVKKIRETARERPKKIYFGGLGVGFTTLGYTETDIGTINENAITLRGSYNYLLKPPFLDFGGSFYYNAFTAGGLENYSVKFLGINLRMGYVFQQIQDPWRFSLLGGIYYTTSFHSKLPVGYLHIAGPQVFPNVRRIFRNGEAMTAYLKYSPITDGFQLLSFSNREFAIGSAYIWPIGGKSISVSVDFSDLDIVFESFNVQTHSRSLTIGIGFGF